MLIWVIKEGENLPLQPNSRKMRSWVIAERLSENGNKVIWWHSTFSHQLKKLFADNDKEFKISNNFYLNLIHAGEYKKNFSIKRYLHGKRLARNFIKRVQNEEKPDIIICAFPPIDLCYNIVNFAIENNITVILDVQDIWPDAIILKMPFLFKRLAKLVFKNDFEKVKIMMNKATSIVAVSDGFLRRCQYYGKRNINTNDKVLYLGYKSKKDNIIIDDINILKLRKECMNKVLFTYVGTFGLSYQIKLICKVAIKIIKEKRENIHFAFAGNGQNFNKIEKLTKNCINITLLNWLNDEQIQQLLSISDVGMVPCVSDRDTMPNKPYEYFSHGLPIISSLEGDMEELINKNQIGASYQPDDFEKLYDLIIYFANSEKERKLLGNNAKKLFNEKFNSEFIYDEFIKHTLFVHQYKK